MISQKIQALFDFIDYLDQNKTEYIEKYIPLCTELNDLDIKRAKLRPNQNYIDKQLYDKLQIEISEKCKPITQNVYNPILEKLIKLEIWSGDDVYSSIWNNNIAAISDFKAGFLSEDVSKVMEYKQKYLNFRSETNTNFLSLQFVFSNLDEVLKELFDFFKDTDKNEFDSFETKTVKVNSIGDALEGFAKGQNVKFALPTDYFFSRPEKANAQIIPTNITNKIIMGDNFHIGDISNNSGNIAIGSNIKISDNLNGKNETADKLAELINLIRQEQSIEDTQKQSLITTFDKVREELLEPQPSKSKIFTWLSATKKLLEGLVFTHEVTEAVHWVYKNLNFITH